VLARKAVNSVDADELRKVLGNETLFPSGASYTRSMVLSDMEKIADADGLDKLLSEKRISGK
jgi:hypothetical protein